MKSVPNFISYLHEVFQIFPPCLDIFPRQKPNSGFVLNFDFADTRGPLVSGAEAETGPACQRARGTLMPRTDCTRRRRVPLKAGRSDNAVRSRRHPSLSKRHRVPPPRAVVADRLTSLHFLCRSPPAAPLSFTLMSVRPVTVCARAPPHRSSPVQDGRCTPSSCRHSRRFSPCAGRRARPEPSTTAPTLFRRRPSGKHHHTPSAAAPVLL
jgi:hypothetical protein